MADTRDVVQPDKTFQGSFDGTLIFERDGKLDPDGEVSKLFFGHEDLTLYFKAIDFMNALKALYPESEGVETFPAELMNHMDPIKGNFMQTIDLSGKVKFADCLKKNGKTSDDKDTYIKVVVEDRVRIHAALCFGKKYYSITIRSDGRKKLKSDSQPVSNGVYVKGDIDDDGKGWKNDFHGKNLVTGENFWNDQNWKDSVDIVRIAGKSIGDIKGDKTEFISDLSSIAESVFEASMKNEEAGNQSTGLILITGGTGSGKTQVLNGILAKLLYYRLRHAKDRRPHVVTAGDPVETFFYDKDSAWTDQIVPEKYTCNPVDYTARTIGIDVSSVEHALNDALREKPSVYVISELRSDEDFRAVLKFAATGHLVITTAHSTSLVDAMRRLMTISSTEDTPNQRSLLAQRLKAVVHLKSMPVDFNPPIQPKDETKEPVKNSSITLPTIWMGNSSGIRNFVSDGLASILPHGVERDRSEPNGSLGYAWTVKKLCENDRIAAGWAKDDAEKKAAQDQVKRFAHQEDLKIS